MGTTRYTNYASVNWDIPIWNPDWKQVDNLLTNQEQGYQLAEQALNAPIDSSQYADDPMIREQLRLNREQAKNDLASTYKNNGINAGNKALQGYIQQLQKDKNPGGIEYQLMQNKAGIQAYREKLNKTNEKGADWSPDKKDAWFALNMANYKGSLQGDELKGFSGQDLAKYQNGIELADKIAKEMIPKTTEGRFIEGKIDTLKPAGRDLYSDGHGHLHWDEAKGVELTPEEIMNAVLPQMQLNPEWKSYSRDNSKIELFQGGVNEKTWQPLIEQRKQNISAKLDLINNAKNDKQLVSELKGIPISKLSEYKDEDIKSYIEREKASLNLEGLKLQNIKSYNDLIEYHSNENTMEIAKSAGNIYKRDDLSVSPKNIVDEFGKLLMADDLKNKSDREAKQSEDLDPNDYWYGNTRIFNTKIDSEFIKDNDTYKEVTTNFNEDSKKSAMILTSLTNEYNDALKNPNNNTGNILRKAGWDFEKKGKFFDYTINPSNGVISLKEAKWNDLNKQGELSGTDFQELQKIRERFKEQSANLNTIQNNQLSRILLYQTKTGDLNITDNLKDVTENSYLGSNGKPINEQVNYKQFQEVGAISNTKTYNDYRTQAIKELKKSEKYKNTDFNDRFVTNENSVIQAKIKEIKDKETSEINQSFVNDYYDKYVEYRKSKNKDYKTKDEVLKYGFVDYDGLSYGGNRDFLKDVVEKDKLIKSKTNVLGSIDLTANKKEKSYDDLMSKFDGIITTTGREYYMNALAYNDTKSQSAVNGKSKAFAEQVMSNIKSYATAGQVNNLINMNGMTPIGNQEDLNKIVEAMTKMRLPDIDNPDKLMQVNDKGFTVTIIDGEVYGVANIIFDEPQNFNGNDKNKGIAVGFKIDNTMPQLKSWLMDTEQLASEFELQQQKNINNDLKDKTVSKIDYPILGGPNLKANIIENISPSLNKQGFYNIQLFDDIISGPINGQTNNIINLATNNPYFPTELGNYIVNLERNKDKLALMKELQFNNNEIEFKNHIIKELKEKESNLTEVQLNSLYDRFIQPRIKDGKSPTISSPNGNFPNPQGFIW